MYNHLQQKAKEYVIGWLNNNQDGLVFDIDTTHLETTIIKCHSKTESIDMIIGETEVPGYVLKYIEHKIYDYSNISRRWLWTCMIRYLLQDVFRIYKFDVNRLTPFFSEYSIMNIKSQIYGVFNYRTECFDMVGPDFDDYTYFFDKLVNKSPFLVLLDPIEYFRCCSLVIKDHNLRVNHTAGIYELFLSRFPEKNDALFRNYLVAYTIFQPYCQDISYLVLVKFLDLLHL